MGHPAPASAQQLSAAVGSESFHPWQVGPSGDHVRYVRLLTDPDLAVESIARTRLARLCRDEAVRFLVLLAGADRFIDVRGLDLLIGVSTWLHRRAGLLIVVDPPASLRVMVEVPHLAEQPRLATTVRQAMALADLS